jgi:hypothetical protein
MCFRCKITNREAAALGVLNECDGPANMPEPDDLICHVSNPKHRARAVEAIAREICSTDMTDGFCGPRDGQCPRAPIRDCIKRAEGCMRAIETVGCMVTWPYDKDKG